MFDSYPVPMEWGPDDLLFRNQASIVAFTVPENFKAGNGVSIVGTHTDSPNLKVSDTAGAPGTTAQHCEQLRPVSKMAKNGYLQVACETYGGTWHSLEGPK